MCSSDLGFADELEGTAGEDFEKAAIDYVKQVLRDHQRIIFDGNGYAEEWTVEAEKRGLSNYRTTADALPCLLDPKNIKLFEEFGILNETEVRSRYEVKLEKYNKLINIEARTMKRMVRQMYLPAIRKFAAEVSDNVLKIKSVDAGADMGAHEELIRRLVADMKRIYELVEKLDERSEEHTSELQSRI